MLSTGVGLVLVAISWIALRITIKTYKSNTQRARPDRRQANLRPVPIGRLLPSNSCSLQRNLLNERLYMMAAAAAAAAAITRQSTADNPPVVESVVESTGGFISSLKQRLPRSIQRLISASSSREPAPDSSAANSSQAALAALLHQYQMLLPPHHHPQMLFGTPEVPFRPPPPSYNAAMQDQRLNMLLQERAALHQLSPGRPQPPPPPPPSHASSHSELRTQPESSGQLRAQPNLPEATQLNQPADLVINQTRRHDELAVRSANCSSHSEHHSTIVEISPSSTRAEQPQVKILGYL